MTPPRSLLRVRRSSPPRRSNLTRPRPRACRRSGVAIRGTKSIACWKLNPRENPEIKGAGRGPVRDLSSSPSPLGEAMPYINGRYHINPIMGHALEAAREAESAIARAATACFTAIPPIRPAARPTTTRAIHAILPAPAGPPARARSITSKLRRLRSFRNHAGRAVRGFVARVHRLPADRAARPSSPSAPSAANTPPPETHVFSDHRDLVNFLRDELARK